MKKRLAMAVLGLLLALGLCACGNDDVKVITKDGVETGAENEKEENGDADNDADADDEDAGKDSDDADELKGYVFTADGIDMAMDMDMVVDMIMAMVIMRVLTWITKVHTCKV